MRTIRIASLLGALFATGAASAVEHCYDFSRMPVGTVYRLGDVHVDNYLEVIMSDFFVDSIAVQQGDANRVSVGNTALAQGTAPEIHTYMLNARVRPYSSVSKVTMKVAQNVGQSGKGNVNLGVNGELRHMAGPLSAAHGKTMGEPSSGRVLVEVALTPDTAEGSYWHRGTVTLTATTGRIDVFTIGGQPLNLDEVCLVW